MKLRSVRVRLTLWNIAVLALALVGFGAAVDGVLRADLDASIDHTLVEDAHRVQARWTQLRGVLPNRPAVGPVPTSLRSSPEELEALLRRSRIFSLRGKALSSNPDTTLLDPAGFRAAAAGRTRFHTMNRYNLPLRVITAPLDLDGRVTAIVEVGYPLDDRDRLLHSIPRTLGSLAPIALIAAGLGGLFLADRALRPVRQIRAAAQEISARDLSRRLDTPGDDEFSELARTMNDMFARLESAFEQERRFTADASHELKTPLTRILANTSLALASERTAPEYRRALEVSQDAARTMNRIVQDLLLLARSDTGRLELTRQNVRLEEILACSAEAPAGRVAPPVRIELQDRSLSVWGDPHHLQRLFDNLVDNAVRHTPASGEVVLSAHAAGETAIVTVNDTGEGIPPEHLPHVTERFYRVDSARARAGGGTGLGLAIARSIAEAHHGTLNVRSTVGKGTTVTVTLPRTAGLADTTAGNGASADLAASRAGTASAGQSNGAAL